MTGNMDIVDKLFGLHNQDPDHIDRDYLNKCIRNAVLEILSLRQALKQARKKQRTDGDDQKRTKMSIQ